MFTHPSRCSVWTSQHLSAHTICVNKQLNVWIYFSSHGNWVNIWCTGKWLQSILFTQRSNLLETGLKCDFGNLVMWCVMCGDRKKLFMGGDSSILLEILCDLTVHYWTRMYFFFLTTDYIFFAHCFLEPTIMFWVSLTFYGQVLWFYLQLLKQKK